jgi:hypothetical protein
VQTQQWKGSRWAVGATVALLGWIVLTAMPLPAAGQGEIQTPDYAPVENTTSFGGTITSRSASMLSLENNVFTLDAETTWRIFNAPTTDTSLFDVGDLALVRAVQVGESWVAREVVIVANLVNDEGLDDSVAPTPSAVFSGQIAAIGADSLTVQGMTLLVDGKTVWKAEGVVTGDISRFDVGDQVVAQGSFDGKTWHAASVELTVNNIGDEPPAKQVGPAPQPTPAPGEKDPADPVSFSGIIQTFLPERMVLDTGTFVLNEATVWELHDGTLGLPEMFGVGDSVTVSAVQSGEDWVAVRVTMLTNIDHT